MNTTTVSTTGREFVSCSPRRIDGLPEIVLHKNQLHSWSGNHVGMVIEAREGTVWLTQTDDRADVVLTSGECFRVNRPGQVVAQSLAPTARLVASN